MQENGVIDQFGRQAVDKFSSLVKARKTSSDVQASTSQKHVDIDV